MYEVKVGYSVTLAYATLEDAERAMEVLFEGGTDEVTVKFKSSEVAA